MDSNQLRSLLGLAPIPDGTIGSGGDQRQVLDLYRGPFTSTPVVVAAPARVEFITLVDLYLDYGTFLYASHYDDRTVLYLPRLLGHAQVVTELPDLFTGILGQRSASVRFSPVETGDLESPTLAYHAATSDLYSQHARVRIYDLRSLSSVMTLNAPITNYDLGSGGLSIEDDTDAAFDVLLPKKRLREVYPEMDASTGRGQDPPFIIPFGVMRKVPLYLVELADDGYSNPEYRYGAVRKPTAGTLTFATIYRDGQVVDADEYAIVENPDGHMLVAFLLDQRDTGGRPLPILADLISSEFGHSPAAAIKFLLSDSTYGLGQPVNAASFTQADLDYLGIGERIGGGLWQQVTLKTLLPLLLLHGAYLSRNDSNEWVITVDTREKHGQPDDAVLQLGLGDSGGWQNIASVQARQRRVNERIQTLTVKGVWDPDFSGSGTWLVTTDRTRGVTGAPRIVENPYIPDAGTVDREAHYLFLRATAQDRSLALQVTPEAYVLDLGTLVKVSIPNYSLTEQVFEVRSRSFVGDQSTAFDLGLWGWEEAAFLYVPGNPSILPRANVLSDFRRTPPDEPTGYELLGYVVRTGEEGVVESLASFIADAPSDNVTHLVFVSYRAGSAVTRSMVQVAVEPGDTEVAAELAVTPGLYYDYECYALNVNNDADRQESTRAQILNQLAIGDITPPNPPTGLTATAGVGRTISLDWNDNTEDDFKTYIVYRSRDAGFSSDYNTDVVGEVRVSRMVDQHEILYDTFYYYRVRAKDLTNNPSGWSNTAVAYVHRITSPDVGTRVIHTEHRQSFNGLFSSISIDPHTSLSFDTGLDTEAYMYSAGVLGVQSTTEWNPASSVDMTRIFLFVASGPDAGAFDANYHGGFWNGADATWSTTMKARGW